MAEQALDENCLTYQDRQIHVNPIFGWGWSGGDVPSGFDIRIAEFCRNSDGNVIGGIGFIEPDTHKYANHWVVFRLRYLGKYDFKNNRGHYDVRILRERPQAIPELILKHRPEPAESQVDAGYAIIGEPLDRAERFKLWKLNATQLFVFGVLAMPKLSIKLLTNPGDIKIIGDGSGAGWFFLKAFTVMIVFWSIVLGAVLGLVYGAYQLGSSFG